MLIKILNYMPIFFNRNPTYYHYYQLMSGDVKILTTLDYGTKFIKQIEYTEDILKNSSFCRCF